MRPAPTGRRDAVLAFLGALGLYWYTLAPGLQWSDSAALALEVRESHVLFGTAGDHPLYVLLGMAFAALPGDPTRNLNFLSAVAAALAVALTLRIASKLAGARTAGWLAAAALAVAHAFWLHAVIAEVYTLNALFAVLLLWLLLEWRDRGQSGGRLVLVGVVFLVGLTNHLVLAGLLPALALFVLTTKPSAIRAWAPWLLAVCVGGAAVAGWLLPDPGATLSRVLHGPPAIVHYFRVSTDVRGLGREVLFYILYLCYQFPVAGPLFGLWGFASLRKRDPRAATLLGLAIVVNAAIFINNTEWRSLGSGKYVFYIQDYTVFAILLGYGMWDAGERWSRGRHAPIFGHLLTTLVALVPIVVYRLAPVVLDRMGIDVTKTRDLPYRDTEVYFLNPGKRGEVSAQQFGKAAFRAVEPGAVIVADYTPRVVLEYLQKVERMRPDVLLLAGDDRWGPRDVTPQVAEHEGRPIYIVSPHSRYYEVDTLQRRFDIVPMGPLYRLRERRLLEAVPH